MTTRSFWLFSALLLGLALVGLLTARSVLIALALPLLAYLGLAVFYAPAELQLKATRTLSTDKITQGMEVTVRVSVVNEGKPLEELSLSEPWDWPVQSLEGETARVTPLDAGQAAGFEYTLRGQRGRYRFEALRARALDPCGLFETQSRLPTGGELLVYPEVVRLKAIPIRPSQTKGFSGPLPSRKSGVGMDFFGVRAYQMGDALRHINWKTSARHTADLFTNEYEQERIADISLILDARPHADLAVQGRRLFEHSVQTTAALAQMFLDQGHCLSLLIYGAGVTRVFPGYGKLQRARILRALAGAETGTNYALEQLRYLPTRLLPPRGQLVYISPLARDDLEPLLRFRAQGYEMLVVSPDPLWCEQLNEPDPAQPAFKLAARYARIERSLLFNHLRRVGIQVVDWKIDQPLLTILERIRRQYTLSRRAVKVRP